jgi:hypothetical protein
MTAKRAPLNPSNPSPGSEKPAILLGTPTLGLVRIEWHTAMASMVCPPNWSLARSAPLNFSVPDAQNMLADSTLRNGHRALILIEDDTVPPPDALIAFDRWFWKMERKKAPPIISGLYHIKGSAEVRTGRKAGIELLGPEPLIYRGSGNRAYRDWKPGDVVWCSGIPTGALLIHRSVLAAWAQEKDIPTYSVLGYPFPMKKIFEQPAQVWMENGQTQVATGTSDLYFSDQTIRRKILAKAGWPEYAKREYPYIVDTALRFGHIDRSTGLIY